MKSRSERYGMLTILIHWLTLLVLIAVYATIEIWGQSLEEWHILLGLLILPLLALRIVGRLIAPVPPIVPALPAMQLRIAGFVHLLFYLILLVLPILGWLLVNARGDEVVMLGWRLPTLIGPDPARAADLIGWHHLIGNITYGLIAFHTLGTLFHHYGVKDNTVRRMLP